MLHMHMLELPRQPFGLHGAVLWLVIGCASVYVRLGSALANNLTQQDPIKITNLANGI